MIDELGGALNVYKRIFFSQMIIAHNYPGGSRKYYADVLHKLIAENMYVDFIYIFIMRGEGAGMWVIVWVIITDQTRNIMTKC